MDPLKELQQEYNQVCSSKTGLSRHLELLLASVKKEIVSFDESSLTASKTKEPVYYKTSSKEIITIPTFLLPSIIEELKNNKDVLRNSIKTLTDEATKVFSAPIIERSEKRVSSREHTKNTLIKSSRKAKKRINGFEERLALNQEKRIKLNICDSEEISPQNLILKGVTKSALVDIKKKLRHLEGTTLISIPGIKKIASVRISDSLKEAEYKARRTSIIDEMITNLKREDGILEQIKR